MDGPGGPGSAAGGGAGAPGGGGHEHAPADPPWVRTFHDTSHEWRRLFSELLGTFLLVLAAVGAHVSAAVAGVPLNHAAAVTAPALMVMAVILFMGKVGGAHLNPVVSVAFAMRAEFPWRRVPGYVLAQFAGGMLACLFLWAVLGRPQGFGTTFPAPAVTDLGAMLIEAVLTMGLVSTILGTAASAQNVGPLSAIAVGGYIALAGLWADPVTGASMNPVRSLAPALVAGRLDHLWVYLVGPTVGAVVAVGFAIILRGRGHDPAATAAAQGS